MSSVSKGSCTRQFSNETKRDAVARMLELLKLDFSRIESPRENGTVYLIVIRHTGPSTRRRIDFIIETIDAAYAAGKMDAEK
jgi:hypothetical protein